ncbi:MAG: ribosome-associated translation inhibitor RaiA [Patescibacteria group bacterium]|nr:ribosome-associated translation inhibitor RaiA [Patescibacteria group bacterium]
MLQKFEIQGVHTTVDDKLRAYVNKKLGGLDKYMPKAAKDSAHLKVHLKEAKKKNNAHCTCEATLHMPHQDIVIKESALNMYAAVDIMETKLKQHLQKYKELHGSGKGRRHLFARFNRKKIIDNTVPELDV